LNKRKILVILVMSIITFGTERLNKMKTVLVVDDEIVVRCLFERILKEYNVLMASSGGRHLELRVKKNRLGIAGPEHARHRRP